MIERAERFPEVLRATVGAALAALLTVHTAAQAPRPMADPALSSPARPQADRDRDAQRRPAELLAFAGVKPGDAVADIMPGGGYFTRLFAASVGPQGKVIAVVPQEFATVAPKAAAGAQAIAAEPALGGTVSALIVPVGAIAAPQPLDIAWTAQNYHDVYNAFGADKAQAMDDAVFKALKPGGVFVVVDHVANAGTAAVDAKRLHRIDPAIVKAQVLAAGFELTGESEVLRNPADPHDAPVFDPAVRGHTDQFAYRFTKPMR